jgi:hypothetical protein
MTSLSSTKIFKPKPLPDLSINPDSPRQLYSTTKTNKTQSLVKSNLNRTAKSRTSRMTMRPSMNNSTSPYTCLYKNNISSNSDINKTMYATSLQIYKHKVPPTVKTSFTNNSTYINSKIKENTIATKEKKTYMEKVQAIKKRILALQQQQDLIDKKQKFYEKKQKQSEQIKQDKQKLQSQIEKVLQDKEKEKKEKKIKAQQNKQSLWHNINQRAKENEKIKREKFVQALTERKMADEEVNNYHSQRAENNKLIYSKAKQKKQKLQIAEQKMFLNKEQEKEKYYTDQVEGNMKEADKLRKEYEELAKVEMEAYQKLKDSMVKTEEMGRVSVNRISFIDGKIKRQGTRSEKADGELKPFHFSKNGTKDSFYYTHQSKKTYKY